MSSVTTLITERPQDQPLSATVGLTARTSACCGSRCRAVDQVGHRADDGLGVTIGDVAGVHMPVEQRREPFVSRRGPAVPLGEPHAHVRLLPRCDPTSHLRTAAPKQSTGPARAAARARVGPSIGPIVLLAQSSDPRRADRRSRSAHGQEVRRRHPLRRRTRRRVRGTVRPALRRLEARAHGGLRRVGRRGGGRVPRHRQLVAQAACRDPVGCAQVRRRVDPDRRGAHVVPSRRRWFPARHGHGLVRWGPHGGLRDDRAARGRDGSVLKVVIHAKAHVPIVGGKIEHVVGEQFMRALRKEQQISPRWFAE